MTSSVQPLPARPASRDTARAAWSAFAGEAARTRALFALVLLTAKGFSFVPNTGFWFPGHGWLHIFGQTMLEATIGTVVWWLCVTLADTAYPPQSRRWMVYAFAGICSGVIGGAAGQLTQPAEWFGGARSDAVGGASEWWQVIMYSIWTDVLVSVAYFYRMRWRFGNEALNGARLERALLTRRATETHLHAMQARVNPQFLFDTLADVERLCDSEPGRADRMLECLITYLRAATPLSDDSAPSLATEVALVRAFLELVRIRFDEHIADPIDVSDAANDAQMPSMLLLPLIEHAWSCCGSSSISLSCRVDGDRQRLIVSTRYALRSPEPNIENVMLPVRDRLAELYGANASLVAARPDSRTTEIIMEIPHERTERSDR